MKANPVLILALSIPVFVSCDIFEYSPYQANLEDSHRDVTARNLTLIRQLEPESPEDFSFALIADNHSAYDELLDAVLHVNANQSASFVLHVGDLTEMGLLKEYHWAREILDRLDVPYLTVIGNHDCLANGVKIYSEMFGSLNYSFTFQKAGFVLANTNAWEFSSNVPDYSWLDSVLADYASFDVTIVVAHVPPWGDQLCRDGHQEKYAHLLTENGVSLSIHGHTHGFFCGEYYKDGVTYLTIDNLDDRNYCIVTVKGGMFEIERIFY
ncbi:MAG: metallophosphoesterase [Candidatus Zixiibacteriota bacterium]|nr:MAG: metallophosphoesterase [candidate division Zixibacteria bacterium]